MTRPRRSTVVLALVFLAALLTWSSRPETAATSEQGGLVPAPAATTDPAPDATTDPSPLAEPSPSEVPSPASSDEPSPEPTSGPSGEMTQDPDGAASEPPETTASPAAAESSPQARAASLLARGWTAQDGARRSARVCIPTRSRPEPFAR